MSEWIPFSERPPTQADADEYGCVLVWHIMNGVLVRGWENDSGRAYISHWMHTPEGPEGAEQAKAQYSQAMEAQYGAGIDPPWEEQQ